MRTSIDISKLLPELAFTTSTSSGPGGQHANKVASRVTVRFDVRGSDCLTDDEKVRIEKKLASRLTNEGILLISAQESRSQLRNKELVLEKLEKLLHQALVRRKTRKATKPSKGAIESRLKKKKALSEKKQRRQKF